MGDVVTVSITPVSVAEVLAAATGALSTAELAVSRLRFGVLSGAAVACFRAPVSVEAVTVSR